MVPQRPLAPLLQLSVQYATAVAAVPSRPRVRRLVKAALRHAGIAIGSASLTIRFVDEEEARELNRSFRARDYATNVLTFPYPDQPGVVAGDIVICMPVVVREANQQGKDVAAHGAHLVVHGTLHACGFDHEVAVDALRMEAIESEALRGFGIADPYEG